METVVQPPAEAELHLLTDWSEAGRRERTRAAAIGTLIAHTLLIGAIVVIPWSVPPLQEEIRRTVTPLVEPLTELTQKAPNTDKVTKEFNARDLQPRPRIETPPPSAARPAPPPPAPFVPPQPATRTAQPPPLPEAPKLEARTSETPKIELPQPQAPPPPTPQIQAEEKAKSPFESVPPPAAGVPAARSQVPIPGSPIDEAVRRAARGDQGSAAGGPGLNLPSAQGSRAVLPQLLSDPMGVDFRAYLTQILASVRRNWMAVMPESVRLGRRGQTAIVFSIARDGKVPKLVISSSAGAEVLDRAAISGISASSPFPPLPTDFKGDHIVVQFNFSYNMPRQ